MKKYQEWINSHKVTSVKAGEKLDVCDIKQRTDFNPDRELAKNLVKKNARAGFLAYEFQK